MLLLPALALAAEPTSPDAPLPPTPAVSGSVVIPWSAVGFSPARVESAAFGPDQLAAGPDGAWALWDPVEHRVFGSGFTFGRASADGLAFAPDGDLLLLDDRTRVLERWSVQGAPQLVARVPLSGLSPVGATLSVTDELAAGRDAFGNLHPLADLTTGGLGAVDGARLLPPAHHVRVTDGALSVDQRATALPATPVVGARAVGDWVIAETGQRGAITGRYAVAVTTGRATPLASRAGAPYRPMSDVSAAPDGTLLFLDPQADGLHLVRVTP